ncbi:MAG: radical SAM protein [DPANN group archaeon]|nr:radical SAM protein [DPANN group archaeon]
MPKHVDLIVGHTCNNRCIHCFMENTREGLKTRKLPLDKTFSQLEKAINKYAEDGYKSITFTGGEATIRPDFLELAQCVKKNKMKVSIQSNGRTFADKKFSENIMHIKPDLSVTIPIHSTKEEVHDMITRISGSFRQTITGILNLVDVGCKNINIKTVINKYNYTDVVNIAKLAKDIGAKQYNLSAPQMNGNLLINWKDVAVNHTEIAPHIKKAIDYAVKLGLDIKFGAIPFCFMKGYEKYNYDIQTSIITSIEADKSIRDNDNSKESILFDLEVGRRTKFNVCKQCKYFNVCMGVWKEYPDVFGISEFKPVLGEKITSAKEFVDEIGKVD